MRHTKFLNVALYHWFLLSYQTHFKVVNPILDLIEVGNTFTISANLVFSTSLQWVTKEVNHLKTHNDIHQEVSCKLKEQKWLSDNIGTYRTFLITISIQIAAVATINFSLTGVQLLIEDGSYLKVVFINFGVISPGTVHKMVTRKTCLWGLHLIIEIWFKKKQPCCRRIKQRASSAMLLPQINNCSLLAIMATPT